MDRRDFLKTAGGTVLISASGTYAFKLLTSPYILHAEDETRLTGKRYGMVINLDKCKEGCTACVDACHHENNVGSFDDKRWDIHWLRKVKAEKTGTAEKVEKEVLLLCIHCDNPPCGQVCPVQATYKREDGIVIVDHHRCIGCRYCVVACPYNARYFNWKDNHHWTNKEQPKRSHGVAESCTLCAHRLDVGRPTACSEVCPENAIIVGDLNDQDSEIAQLMESSSVTRLREGLGTEPKVHYIGL